MFTHTFYMYANTYIYIPNTSTYTPTSHIVSFSLKSMDDNQDLYKVCFFKKVFLKAKNSAYLTFFQYFPNWSSFFN